MASKDKWNCLVRGANGKNNLIIYMYILRLFKQETWFDCLGPKIEPFLQEPLQTSSFRRSSATGGVGISRFLYWWLSLSSNGTMPRIGSYSKPSKQFWHHHSEPPPPPPQKKLWESLYNYDVLQLFHWFFIPYSKTNIFGCLIQKEWTDAWTVVFAQQIVVTHKSSFHTIRNTSPDSFMLGSMDI